MPDHHIPRSSNLTSRIPPAAVSLGAVLAGGLIGSGARTFVGAMLPTATGSFPVATLVVNLSGSLMLGFYLARRERAVTSRWSLQFWAIGALGSLTTFSAFSVEAFELVRTGSGATALGYVVASTAGGLAAAVIGDRAGRARR